jgi:hypothetical protein
MPMYEWLNHTALQIVRVLPGSFDPLIPPGLDRRPKVFGIGFHKTGTSTLGHALRTLGYRVQKGRAFNHPGKLAIPEPVTIDKLWDAVRPLIPLYAAFEDNPWPLLYRQLDAACPGAKFIFTYRDTDRWLRSASRYFSKRNNATLDLIYGRRNFRIADNEAIALARYEQHNTEIREYFRHRPQDVLTWNLETEPSWEPLCRFLNCPVPARAFPHANAAGVRVRNTPAERAAA